MILHSIVRSFLIPSIVEIQSVAAMITCNVIAPKGYEEKQVYAPRYARVLPPRGPGLGLRRIFLLLCAQCVNWNNNNLTQEFRIQNTGFRIKRRPVCTINRGTLAHPPSDALSRPWCCIPSYELLSRRPAVLVVMAGDLLGLTCRKRDGHCCQHSVRSVLKRDLQ